jgi:hypothetical protein
MPGYIRSEMNERVKHAPFMVDTDKGVRAMVRAIEAEKTKAFVPAWPWSAVAFLMKRLPLRAVTRLF